MPVFKLRVRLTSVLGYFAYGFVFRYAVTYTKDSMSLEYLYSPDSSSLDIQVIVLDANNTASLAKCVRFYTTLYRDPSTVGERGEDMSRVRYYCQRCEISEVLSAEICRVNVRGFSGNRHYDVINSCCKT